MTDAELDKIICDIQHMFPNCGYKMVQGHLNGLGLRIQSKNLFLCLKGQENTFASF